MRIIFIYFYLLYYIILYYMSSSTLAIDEAKCPGPTDTSRKEADNIGSGKTWRIGTYKHNGNNVDDAGEADRASCGPFIYYNGQHSGGSHIDMGQSSSGVTSSNMNTLSGASHNYIEDGHTKSVQPTQQIGTITLSGEQIDSHEPWPQVNNWTRTCMKNDTGYLFTNPYDGTPLGNSESVEGKRYSTNSNLKKFNFHKSGCCGFHETGSAGDPDYCHSNYCNIGDTVSTKCRNHLANLCKEPEFFAKSPYCKLPKDAYAAGGGGADLTSDPNQLKAGKYSLSLKTPDYKRIGKEVCVKDENGVSPFEPLGEEPAQDDAGYEEYQHKLNLRNACVTWCGRNETECRSEITDFCEGVYDEAVANKGIGGKRFIDSQRVCGCNFPPKYYTDLRKNYSENFGVPLDKLSATPYCINYSCKTSEIGDTRDNGRGGIHDDNQGECGSVNILNCVQELNFEVDEINVMDGGSFTFAPEQSNDCKQVMSEESYSEIKDYYNNNVSESTSSSSSKSESITEGDNMMYLGIFLIICCCCCFLLIMIMFMFDGDDSSGSSGSSGSSDINTQLEKEL
jgi:hypothetical protein